MKSFLWKFVCLVAISGNCQKHAASSNATNSPIEVPVVPSIAEASGIADSKTNPGALWVIEDSGNPAQLILLGHDGKVRSKIPVKGATNQDWEDVVLSNGFLYIGDIGDNGQQRQEYQIYKLPEPEQGATETAEAETIRFRYEDRAHDAEAFLVLPHSGDIYIITKRDERSGIYKIAQPYSLYGVNVAKHVATLPFKGVVSATLSPDGSTVLVKTYPTIYRFAHNTSELLVTDYKTPPTEMPYKQEPQGEAVCYKLDGSGYFTLSERVMGSPLTLFFYPK